MKVKKKKKTSSKERINEGNKRTKINRKALAKNSKQNKNE